MPTILFKKLELQDVMASLFYGDDNPIIINPLSLKAMHIIIWEFMVKSDKENEFINLYGSEGEWSNFFQKSNDYIGTDFLKEVNVPMRYVTIDKWKTKEAYDSFLHKHKSEYCELDQKGDAMTVLENKYLIN